MEIFTIIALILSSVYLFFTSVLTEASTGDEVFIFKVVPLIIIVMSAISVYNIIIF